MNILVASSIDSAALDSLGQNHDVRFAVNAPEDALMAAIQDREVLVFRSGVTISAGVMQRGPQLRLLVRAGSGLDNVDVAYAREHGIRLVRIPGSSAQPVAELTFALMLAAARNVALADRLIREGRWPKSELGGPLLAGKTLGIVGTGNIGGCVGQLGAAWGMRSIGCVRHPSAKVAAALDRRGITLTDFDTVLAEADFLSLHVPLDDSTHHMIDAAALAGMRKGSFLINMARGGVVDDQALYRELTEGETLLGAALDVHELEGEGTIPQLAELPNVVLTPHIGAMAVDAQREIGRRLIELVDAFAQGALDQTTKDGELVA
jgi:phosphoglycerate dehydrogenase-like enzyme